ncbi:uncharacterized protein LOC119577201, partial [Penaeus monodon]|uniref:uncharacterized protein LOC119577201 n=1 Tax=Penaeus monodon TaxID=6687 RepID=UPI0018A7A439
MPSRRRDHTRTITSPSTPLRKASKPPTSAKARPRLAPCPRGLSKEPLLLLIALLACTCSALPTLPPITYPHPAVTAQEPASQEWRQCCDTGYPPANQSGNLTVLRTSPTSVLVTWTRQSPPHVKYEVTYKPTNAKYRVVVEVLAPQSSVMLERLLPLTQYQVHVSIIANNSALWTSPVVTFHTTRDDVFQVFNNSTPTIIDAIDVSVGGIEGSDVTPLENLGALDQKVGLVRV